MKSCKYKKLKQQQSFDGGDSWIDVYQLGVLVTKKGDLIASNSSDCGYMGEYIRWVETTGYICVHTTHKKYAKEIKQTSTDGINWTDTDEYRQGRLLEENSKDCGYAPPLEPDTKYKWVDSGFECGSNLSSDSTIVMEAPGELTKETVYRWVVAEGADDYICDGKTKYYLYVKQQSTDGGLTWSEVQPRETQKGAVINNNSVDCSCETVVTYNDGTTGSYTIHHWLDSDDIPNFKSESAITLDIGTCITGIRAGGFSGCTNLQKIFIPYSVSEIGSTAFSHCTSLQSIEMPNNVIKLSSGAFSGCTGLMEVKIGNGINGINSGVFEDCTSLSSITLGDNIKFIGSSAFENCSSLQKINIPSGVTKIQDYTFENCSSLQKINIPSGVTEILEKAFFLCKSLSSVTINNSVSKLKYNTQAFDGISSTAKLYVPSNLVSDYKDDFVWRHFFRGGIYPIS